MAAMTPSSLLFTCESELGLNYDYDTLSYFTYKMGPNYEQMP